MKKTIIAAAVFLFFFMVTPQAFAAHSEAWGQGQMGDGYGQQARYWERHPYTSRYQEPRQGYYPQGQCAARVWWYGSISFSGECSQRSHSYQEQMGGYSDPYTNSGYNNRTYYGSAGNSGTYRPAYGYSGYENYGYTGDHNTRYTDVGNNGYTGYSSGYGAYNQGYIQPGSTWVDASGHSRIQHGW